VIIAYLINNDFYRVLLFSIPSLIFAIYFQDNCKKGAFNTRASSNTIFRNIKFFAARISYRNYGHRPFINPMIQVYLLKQKQNIKA